MIRRRAGAAGIVVTLALLAGCGDAETPALIQPRDESVVRPARSGVLYDEPFTVEEGQWTISSGDGDDEPDYGRFFGSVAGRLAAISVPGLYGRYRTRVELLDAEPVLPAWCEDVAEVSLLAQPADGLAPGFRMWSLDDGPERFAVEPGWYRIRYCAEEQDAAAGQDEFTGDEYTVYAGRHLIQLWRADQAPDAVLRAGSRWARTHAG